MIKKSKAFTLLELLVVVFINLIAITIAVRVFVSLNQDYRILVGYLNSYIKGREMIDLISKDSRMAIRVMDEYAGYATTNSCLVLKVPSLDSSGNILDVNNEFDYIIYRIENGDLWKNVIPGANSSRQAQDRMLKKNIESLHITSKDIPVSNIEQKEAITRITIWVSIAETVLGKKYRINPGTTVKLMNYEWEFIR